MCINKILYRLFYRYTRHACARVLEIAFVADENVGLHITTRARTCGGEFFENSKSPD